MGTVSPCTGDTRRASHCIANYPDCMQGWRAQNGMVWTRRNITFAMADGSLLCRGGDWGVQVKPCLSAVSEIESTLGKK